MVYLIGIFFVLFFLGPNFKIKKSKRFEGHFVSEKNQFAFYRNRIFFSEKNIFLETPRFSKWFKIRIFFVQKSLNWFWFAFRWPIHFEKSESQFNELSVAEVLIRLIQFSFYRGFKPFFKMIEVYGLPSNVQLVWSNEGVSFRLI